MKEKISYILFLFSAVFTYSQVTLAVSDVKDPKVNQRFNLTVILEINGENMEQETPLRMPDLSKFDIIGTASEQNTVVLDSKKGEVLNQMVYQIVLNPKQAGKIKFGSVLVTVNGKIYKTEPFDIYVRENEKKSVAENIPKNSEVYLNLELEDKNVYKNEPVIAVLRVKSRDYSNFRKVSNIHFPPQKSARIKPINFTKSEIETKGEMASQIIGKYMIFPNESGSIEINPASVTVLQSNNSKKVVSNPVRINVKKLPDGKPEHYKNAVGNFNITAVQSDISQKPELELPIQISLKINGSGNFGDFHLPRIIESDNYISFKPKVVSKTATNSGTLVGQLSADYVVIPKKPGPISIQFENFSFFDPNQNDYVELGAPTVDLNVKTHEQIVDAKSTIERVNDYTNTVLETVNTPVLQMHNLKVKDKSKINWTAVVGNIGLMALIFSLFLVVKKRKSQKKNRTEVNVKDSKSIAETEEIIRNTKNHHLQENLEFLKKLSQNKDYEQFFVAYQELNSDTKNYLSLDSEQDFKKYLELNKGAQIADEYKILSEKIQIEKFAPFYNEEQIEELLQNIIRLYEEIVK